MSYRPPLLRALAAMGHRVFGPSSRDYDLQIVGIRRAVSLGDPDHYSDDLVVSWQQSGIWRQFSAALSTTPGTYYLEHPMRPAEGCAIMAPGQYQAYTRGLHKGRRALVQRAGPVRWYRDNDRDSQIMELGPDTETQEGYAGLNIHGGSRFAREDSEVADGAGRVGRFSAGCQIAHPDDIAFLMELADRQVAAGMGDKFTYTLIREEDL